MDLKRALTEQAVRSAGSKQVSESLKHYASPYYDPVKAKEYYERTKKLKGDREKQAKADALTTKQRQVYDVVRDNLNTERTKESDKLAADYKAKIEALSARSRATVQSMSNKLRELSTTKDLPLNEIPKNATPRQRALLMKENDRIRAKAKKDTAAERKKIGEGMRQELNKAREAYTSGMAAIKTKYEAADADERKKIKGTVDVKKPKATPVARKANPVAKRTPVAKKPTVDRKIAVAKK